MIKLTTGNILEADVEAVINTVNTVGVMGKGLALQFKRRYALNYDLYRAACKRGDVELGKMFVTQSDEIGGPRWIVNFPTKGHWKANSRISDIENGLDDLKRLILDTGIKSIAIPPLGAGNGGLEWSAVRSRIVAKLGDLDEVNIQIFEPTNSHFAIAGQEQKLTPSKALLLCIMIQYEQRQQEIWPGTEGTSHLEIQKLMYFADRRTPAIGMRFSRGHFGPYSDIVRHLVKDLEGGFLAGFGDGSDQTLDLHPIKVTPAGRLAVESFMEHEGTRERIEGVATEVLDTVDGLEGPYQLELLSTVMWIADEIGTTDKAAVLEKVQSWNVRKERLFTPRHVEIALEQLNAS